ncbi:MAG: hypothetical protein HRU72_06560 [Planctomycetia bacterium]|nr:hypothetical protein [Candidatus Brocadia sp.]QOJ06237.1 MAG: hypothetical protein HRU72_06560 [Planctomycetia bacterium]TVL94807.1 MAG: hypothetical protein CV082_13530 [Candidatus Brocadia sp. BL1]GJQ23453.1 MAG: hypothetical protein HBSAPP01_12430 [Candidatus Brocadia sapporoensis]HQU32189.1 hypothetical protein [Candidatus Brocadia sapporoensis]
MRRLELEINDSIFEKFKNFLELFPKNKVKVKEISESLSIPYVSDEEQKELKYILKDKNCHVISRSKVTKI